MSRGREDLIRWVDALGAPYGLEPSVKLVPGQALSDRFLLTVSRADLGPRPARRLLDLAHALGMDPALEPPLLAHAPVADVVHLGYEAGPPPVYKIYLEHVRELRRERSRPGPSADPILVHFAVKWTPEHPGAIARYTCLKSQSIDSMRERIGALLPARRAADLARDLLDRAASRVAADDILFMEVEEPGNPRRSFDLNLYRAAIPLVELEDWISSTWLYFGDPQPRLEARPGDFGHLAAGTGRDGREFFSLYFGVESHPPGRIP